MRANGIQNPALGKAINDLHHGETIVIADSGLPYRDYGDAIDLSVILGVPRFLTVLEAIMKELVVEKAVYAEELNTKATPEVRTGLKQLLSRLKPENVSSIPHELFKEQVLEAKYVVRTGEGTPYANVILVAGVPF